MVPRRGGSEDRDLETRSWNGVDMLRGVRSPWSEHANAMLERKGFAER